MSLVRVLLIAMAATACTSVCADGERVACRECGPGALLNGLFVAGGAHYKEKVAVAPNGQAVRTCDTGRHIAWLDDSHRTVHETEVVAQNPDGVTIDLAVNGSGDVAAYVLSWDDFGDVDEGELHVYGGEGNRRWHHELGTRFYYDYYVDIGPRLVFLDVELENKTYAFDLTGGAKLFSTRTLGFMPDPNGGAIRHGSFAGTLELGAPVPPLTASGTMYDGYVAGFDDTNTPLWAIQLSATKSARVGHVAVGPNRELALVVWWEGTELVVAGTTLPGPGTAVTSLILLDSGRVRFAHDIGATTIATIATDGNEVVLAGSFGTALAFDPETRAPIGKDAYVAAFGTPGLSWLRIATGPSDQSASFPAIVADRVVGTFETQQGTTTYGDVTLPGAGVTVAALAR